MKITNKIPLLFALLLWVSITFVTEGKETEGEGSFRKLSKTFTLNKDGSQEFRCKKELTLNTHIAMNSLYGETFIVYNPDFQTLKFHSAYTIQADGTKIEVPVNAYNEVLPRAAADAPAYNHLKEMVVTHTGLEIGSTIYLDYSLLTKPGYYPALDIDEILQELSPVKEYTLTINMPESTPFTYQLNNSGIKPSQKKENGNTQYQWILRNTRPLPLDAFLPLNKTHAIRFTASTYPSVENALTGWAKQTSNELNAEWITFTQSLIKDAASHTDKKTIIHNYVLNQIANCGVSLEEAGYKTRNINEVLRTSYGTAAEKSSLLVAMLNCAGLNAELIAIYPLKSAMGLKQIREFAVVQNNGYLSASNKKCTLNNRKELDDVWCITANKTAKAISTTTEQNTVVNTETTADKLKALPPVGGYAILALDCKTDIKSWGMGQLNSIRTEVLEVPALLNEQQIHTIILPSDMTLESPASKISINKPTGNLYITIEQEGNQVKVTRQLELKKQQIQPSEYKEFRTLINTWLDKNTEQLLFKIN